MGSFSSRLLRALCHNSHVDSEPSRTLMEVQMAVISRLTSGLMFAVIVLAAFSLSTFADTPRERVQFGHDVSIAPGEHVGEVTCFGCRVRVRGQVDGDVTTFGGSV